MYKILTVVELSDAGLQVADVNSHVSNGGRLLSDDVIVLSAATPGAQLRQLGRHRRLDINIKHVKSFPRRMAHDQGRRSIWDRGDTSPQYLDWRDIIANVPLNISRVISATFYPCNIFLIS